MVFLMLNRKPLRLSHYDYRQNGAYFVTLCTHHQACLFGHVANGSIILNDVGRMIMHWYEELHYHYHPSVYNDACIIMPNHLHAIIVIDHDTVGADLCVGPMMKPYLPTIMQWFKTMTTNAYIVGVKHHNWPVFDKTLWQRGYYDHIIRDEADLTRIREYMMANPARWLLKEEGGGR
jgi:putative transposase